MCFEEDIEKLPQNKSIEIKYERMSESDVFDMCYKTVIGIIEQFDKRYSRYNSSNGKYKDFLKYVQMYYPK